MTDITTFTATQILAILEPERLFTNDADVAKSEWRMLSKEWHPDRNKDPLANQVITHVNTLYDEAVKKLMDGSWRVPGLFTFKATNGKEFGLRYKKHRPFELGDVYIAEKLVAYVVLKEHEDLYREAKRRITSFKFANDKMKDEVKKYLPKISDEQVTSEAFVMLVEKTPDMFSLVDILSTLGGKLEPKHVAWLVSSMLNIACYFKYAGITHNDISPDTLFVSPKNHSTMLLGGWWYSRPLGEKLLALKSRTIDWCDPLLLKKPLAKHEVDLELIKLTGLEALGDITGSVLLREKVVPPQMLTWLRTSGTDKIFEEYKLWHDKILKECFGPRKFVKLELTPEAVYGAI